VRRDVDAFVIGRLCAEVEGFNLQAPRASPPAIARGWSEWRAIFARPPIANRDPGPPGGMMTLELRSSALARRDDGFVY